MVAVADWNGAVIVAVAIIALIALVMVVAMVRYDADQVLKIWGGLGALTGLVAGSMGSYFFTKPQIEQAQQQVAQVQQTVGRANDALAQASQVLDMTAGSATATSPATRPATLHGTELVRLGRLIDSAKIATETVGRMAH